MSTTTRTAQGLRPSTQQTHQASHAANALAQAIDAETVTLSVPRELAQLLREVLSRVGNGESITFASVPQDVTTSTVAHMLGMSRPTLMKLIRSEQIPSHKVGSHTRLASADVHAFRRKLLGERRAAYEELLQMDEEAGLNE